MRPSFNADIRLKLVRDKLRETRKANKKSQEELASILRCNRATIRSWENEQTELSEQSEEYESKQPKQSTPSIERLFKLCEIYDCDPGYLLCEYNDRSVAAIDIADTLGLLEESYYKLKNFKMDSICNPSGSSSIALSFINYLSEHIDSLSSYLNEKHKLENSIRTFHSEKDNNEILKLLYKHSLTWFSTLNTPANPYNSFDIKDRITHFIMDVCQKEHIEGTKQIDEITDIARSYAHVLDPMYKLQIEYALSQALQNVVTGFFSDYSQYSMDTLSAITSPPRKIGSTEELTEAQTTVDTSSNSSLTSTKSVPKLYIPAGETEPFHVKTSGGSKSKKR